VEDAAFIARLRGGDETAYRDLISRRHVAMVRLAMVFCRIRETAEEVVQETWITVFTGLDTYTGEGSLPSWISGIVVNKARIRAVRDRRMVNFSDLAAAEAGPDAADLDPGWFSGAGRWAEPPAAWSGITPETEASDRQLLLHLSEAIDALPPAQRAAVLLRDVQGTAPAEICQMLEITEGNLRVLLHRARLALRARIDALITPARFTAGGGGNSL